MEVKEEKTPNVEVADIVGGCFNGQYMAIVSYKGDIFAIKEANERQLLGSIKMAVDRRSEVE